MSVLADIWSFLWGVVIAMPFVGFAIVYTTFYFWKKDRRKAARWAVNITNFLLIQAVIVQYGVIWPEAWSAWWWVVLLYAGIIALLAWLQIRLRGKISISKIGASAWRLTFLLFGIFYVVLFTTGVLKTMHLG
jgi:hypothetical protein